MCEPKLNQQEANPVISPKSSITSKQEAHVQDQYTLKKKV